MPFAWIPISLTNFFNVSTLEREVSEAEGLNGTCLSFLTNTKQLFSGSVLRKQFHLFLSSRANDRFKFISSQLSFVVLQAKVNILTISPLHMYFYVF